MRPHLLVSSSLFCPDAYPERPQSLHLLQLLQFERFDLGMEMPGRLQVLDVLAVFDPLAGIRCRRRPPSPAASAARSDRHGCGSQGACRALSRSSSPVNDRPRSDPRRSRRPASPSRALQPLIWKACTLYLYSNMHRLPSSQGAFLFPCRACRSRLARGMRRQAAGRGDGPGAVFSEDGAPGMRFFIPVFRF